MKPLLELVFAVGLLLYVILSNLLTLIAAAGLMGRRRSAQSLAPLAPVEPVLQEESPELSHIMQARRDWQPYMVHITMRAHNEGKGLVMVKEGESVYVCSVGRN